MTVDPFARDGPVTEALAASKRQESDTELLVQVLDEFQDVRAQRERSVAERKLCWHLGQDNDCVTEDVLHDDAALLLVQVAKWCQLCVGMTKVIDPSVVPTNSRGSQGHPNADPDCCDRQPGAALAFADEQRDVDLLLSIWQVCFVTLAAAMPVATRPRCYRCRLWSGGLTRWLCVLGVTAAACRST